ncbi:MAG TPA: adenylate/guanylate cyclase domain-containing protein [Stellaceae bacterium]|nr:adenylate/guanylate cyclase domain-containing protein [Stellaceae bacterium]
MNSLLSSLGRWAGRSVAYWLPIGLLCVAAFARIAIPDVLDRLSLIVFDVYERASPRVADPDAPVRIVDIDDRSLKEVGQWPWSRSLIAKLVDKLREAGAAVVVFDVLFTEPDRISPSLLLPILTEGGASADEVERVLATVPDPDKKLAGAIAKLPVVLGFALTEHGGNGTPARKAGFAFTGGAGENPLSFVQNYPEAIGDLPILQKAAAGDGFVNPHLDWDNVLRRVPLVMRLKNKAVPSLAAEALRLALGTTTYIGRASGASGERSFGENTGLNSFLIGQLTVPTDGAGMVWLHYAPSDARRYISAADILSGNFDRARIADNIVLIGVSAKGLNDLHATPLARDMPGTEVHAQLIEQVLQQNFLSRPDWLVGAETLFTVIVGLLMILLMPRIGALAGAAIGGVAVAGAAGVSWLAFQKAQLLVDPAFPILVIAVVYVTSTLLGYRQTERRQRQIRQAFSRYMSPYMVAELARHPEKLVLGGETKLLTIMFCDIRGFTTLSEGLKAEELGRLINNFLTPMTEIITNHKGTIDKYIGDCIMAFWNAPLDDPDHAKNAVLAAQEMRRRLGELNERWAAEGLRTLHIGIGINTGECCVGNFGSDQRFDYSLLGDPVNLSSRLEGLTKQYGVDLIIGEDTAAMVGNPDFVELDLVAVKGKSRAVRIFTLPPHPTQADQFMARHQALLTAYRHRDWEGALRLLNDGPLAAETELAPVYELFRQRIEHLKIEPPPGDWDGVFVAHEK